jgi:AcrR family transcriptional regulator
MTRQDSQSVTERPDTTTIEGERKRREVLDCAARLFATQGFDNTSINDIAAMANLKKPSLYHYFPSKQSLLVAILTDGMDQLWADASAAAAIKDPVARLDALLTSHLHNFGQKLNHVAVFLLERRVIERFEAEGEETRAYLERRRAYDQLFVDAIRAGQRKRVFRADDPVVMSYAILGMVNWMVQWYRADGALGLEEISAILRRSALSAVSR